MSKVTLITGGARSGKSTFAEDLIREKATTFFMLQRQSLLMKK